MHCTALTTVTVAEQLESELYFAATKIATKDDLFCNTVRRHIFMTGFGYYIIYYMFVGLDY